MQPKHTVFETNFTVFPQNTNYLFPDISGPLADVVGVNRRPMVFGGKVLAEMDIAAAMCVIRAIYGTDCWSALTVTVDNVTFWHGATLGDICYLKAELARTGHKSLDIQVEGEVEKHGSGERIRCCSGRFRFVTINQEGKTIPHGLKI